MVRSYLVAISACVGLALGPACGNEVGRICDLGVQGDTDAGVDDEGPADNRAVIGSPSLDCQSKLCLKVPVDLDKELPDDFQELSTNRGMCTDFCESDDDCDKVPESPCVTGFSCGVAVTVGPFCCQKVCICKDYIVLPEGGSLPTPAACDADNPDNACCNLSGRSGNEMYENCP